MRIVRLVAALYVTLSLWVALTHAAQYTYDDLGRLSQVIDADGNAATYTYDAVGNILSIERGAPSCPLQAPVIATVTSETCYAGSRCQVVIEGNSLLGATVSTGNPQATLGSCQAQCARIACVLMTAGDLPPGGVEFTVATSLGSAPGMLQVAAAPALEAGGRADLWHFAAGAGQTITLTMTRIANQADGSSTLDPYLELQDSRGFVIAIDDDGGSGLPPGPGKNAVVGNLALQASDTYVVLAKAAGGTHGPYVLTLTPATIALLPGAVVAPPEGRQVTGSGTIDTADQRRTFTFAANGGERATIAVNRIANATDGSGTLDPGLELRDSRGFVLGSDSDGGTNAPAGPGRNALLANLLLPATDTYEVVVRGEGGSVGPYEVIVTLQGPHPDSSASAAPASGGGKNP